MSDFPLHVIDRLHFWAQKRPSQMAVERFDGRGLTYAQLVATVSSVGESLRELQLAADQPVLLHLPHDLLKVILILALLEAKIPAISIDQKPLNDLARLLEDVPAQALIAAPVFSENFGAFNKHLQGEVRPLAAASENLLCTSLKNSSGSSLHPSTAWLLLTSGSTGQSKAAELCGRNLNERTEGEIEFLRLKEGDRILNLLSFSHDLGLNQLLTSITAGATLVLGNQFPADLIPILRRGEIAGATGTPHLWAGLLKLEKSIATPFEFSGYLTVSGGAMAEQSLAQLRHLFPNARIVKTYGQTETFRTLASDDVNKLGRASLRPIIPGVRAVLVNEQFREVDNGEIGQLIHFGSGSMTRYFSKQIDNPEFEKKFTHLDNSFFPGERGIITGDYFRQVSPGEFEFVGRHDDLVKRRDFRVSLEEIRQALCRFTHVSDAFVAMVDGKDRYGGDGRLIAWLEGDELSRELVGELERHCKQELEIVKLPDEFRFVRQFERTAAGKIERRRLLEGFNEI